MWERGLELGGRPVRCGTGSMKGIGNEVALSASAHVLIIHDFL